MMHLLPNGQAPVSAIKALPAALKDIAAKSDESAKRTSESIFAVYRAALISATPEEIKATLEAVKGWNKSAVAAERTAYQRTSEFRSLFAWFYSTRGVERFDAFISGADDYHAAVAELREEKKAERQMTAANNAAGIVEKNMRAVGAAPEMIEAATANARHAEIHKRDSVVAIKRALRAASDALVTLTDVEYAEAAAKLAEYVAEQRRFQFATAFDEAIIEDLNRTVAKEAAAKLDAAKAA